LEAGQKIDVNMYCGSAVTVAFTGDAPSFTFAYIGGEDSSLAQEYFAGEGITIGQGNDINVAYIDQNGNFVFKNAQTNTQEAFQINKDDDTNVFSVDTINNKVSVNGALSAASILDAYGRAGTDGQVLSVDSAGQLVWKTNDTCVTNVSSPMNVVSTTATGTTNSPNFAANPSAQAQVGNFVYFVRSAFTPATALQKMDVRTGAITDVGTIPFSAYLPNVVRADDDTLYVFGSVTTTAETTQNKNAYRYKISTNTWTRIADVPNGLIGSVNFTLNGKIYSLSGRYKVGTAETYLSIFQILDIATET
jgi:hypothetical protein